MNNSESNTPENLVAEWVSGVWESDLDTEVKLCCFYLCTVAFNQSKIDDMSQKTGIEPKQCLAAIDSLFRQNWLSLGTDGISRISLPISVIHGGSPWLH